MSRPIPAQTIRPCSTESQLVFSLLIGFEITISPVTSNAERGTVVPTPILPFSIYTLLPNTSPSNDKLAISISFGLLLSAGKSILKVSL